MSPCSRTFVGNEVLWKPLPLHKPSPRWSRCETHSLVFYSSIKPLPYPLSRSYFDMKLCLSNCTWFSGIYACALGYTCILVAEDMARLVRHAKTSLTYHRAEKMCVVFVWRVKWTLKVVVLLRYYIKLPELPHVVGFSFTFPPSIIDRVVSIIQTQ
jgi:hypothetical protein